MKLVELLPVYISATAEFGPKHLAFMDSLHCASAFSLLLLFDV